MEEFKKIQHRGELQIFRFFRLFTKKKHQMKNKMRDKVKAHNKTCRLIRTKLLNKTQPDLL